MSERRRQTLPSERNPDPSLGTLKEHRELGDFMGEIKVTFLLQQSEIGRLIKGPLALSLREGESVIDAVKLVDEVIRKRAGQFPVKGYKSLLHMIYHPLEKRFYSHVAIQGYAGPGTFVNLRENPQKPLPNGVTIILVPEGPCISEGETVVDWDCESATSSELAEDASDRL